MTGKRFVDYFDKDHNYIIQDLQNEDEYQVGFVNCDEDIFLELINQLSDENEERKRAMRIAEYYNKQLEDENKKLKKYIDSISKGG